MGLRILNISCIMGKLEPILAERKAGGSEVNQMKQRHFPKIEEILIYERLLCMFDPKLGIIAPARSTENADLRAIACHREVGRILVGCTSGSVVK